MYRFDNLVCFVLYIEFDIELKETRSTPCFDDVSLFWRSLILFTIAHLKSILRVISKRYRGIWINQVILYLLPSF